MCGFNEICQEIGSQKMIIGDYIFLSEKITFNRNGTAPFLLGQISAVIFNENIFRQYVLQRDLYLYKLIIFRKSILKYKFEWKLYMTCCILLKYGTKGTFSKLLTYRKKN